jgi:hypothetical protein
MRNASIYLFSKSGAADFERVTLLLAREMYYCMQQTISRSLQDLYSLAPCSPFFRSDVPGCYFLTTVATKNPPEKLMELRRWLSTNSPGGNWKGKLYVASSISWNESDFVQEGCSPNYQARRWTLACCKHDMRSPRPINADLRRPTEIGVFVFTLASQDAHGHQPLVSVAKITEHFESMTEYARRLLISGDELLILSRLTRCPRGNSLGWRFGDCHSDESGAVGDPDPDHVHGINYSGSWATDNRPGHRLLMSDRFVVWPRPLFRSNKTLAQSRYGHNISPSNLDLLLNEC